MEVEVIYRFRERIMGGLGYLLRSRGLSIAAIVVMLEGMLSPTVLYCYESQMLNVRERSV